MASSAGRGSAASEGIADWMAGEFDLARRSYEAFAAEAGSAKAVSRAAVLIADSLRAGGKLLACGNGGSCCQAMHLCEEFTARYRHTRPAIGAVACADGGHLTCAGNDFGFEASFARWVEALGRPGDVLAVLSTSGNSENVVLAVEAARAIDVRTVALLGRGGGRLAGVCDVEVLVPPPVGGDASGSGADRVQEVHMLVLHALIGGVERLLFGAEGAERHAPADAPPVWKRPG